MRLRALVGSLFVTLFALPATAAIPFHTVVAEGEPAPGTSGVFVRPTGVSIGASGRIAFRSQVRDPGGDQKTGVFIETTKGLELVALEGSAAPSGGTFNEDFSVSNAYHGDVVTFSVTVGAAPAVFRSDASGPKRVAGMGDVIESKTLGALVPWYATNAAGETLVADVSGALFDVPRTGPSLQVFTEPVSLAIPPAQLSEEGHVLARVGNDLRFGTPVSASAIATIGAPGSGTGAGTFSAFEPFVLCPDGFVVMAGTVNDDAAPDPAARSWTGLWTKSKSGDLELVTKLPTTVDGATLVGVQELQCAASSVYAALARTDRFDGPEQQMALVRRGAGALEVLAKTGDAAPGFDGVTIAAFRSFEVNAKGDLMIDATMSDGQVGLYLVRGGTKQLELVVRTGVPVDLGGARGVVTPAAVGAITSRLGRVLNDAGELAFGIGYPYEGSSGSALLVTGAAVDPGAPKPDLAISALDSSYGFQDRPGGRALAPDEHAFRLVVVNNGKTVATGVRVVVAGETVPASFVPQTPERESWTCTTSDCRGLALAPGAQHEGYVIVKSAIPNVLVFTADTPGSDDANPADNTAKHGVSAPAADPGDGCGCALVRSGDAYGLVAAPLLALLLAGRRRRRA